MESLVLAGRGGRGIAELIKHLSHLETKGWLYLLFSFAISIAMFYALKYFIPWLMKKATKRCFPFFSWVAIPRYNFLIATTCFLIFFSLVGYMSPIGDDVIFFFCHGMGLLLILFGLFARLQRSIMFNQGDYYLSRFALLGIYKKLPRIGFKADGYPDKDIIKLYSNNKKVCKIRWLYYTTEGQRHINEMICNLIK